MVRKLLRDDQWKRIEQMLPGKKSAEARRQRTTGCLLKPCCGMPGRVHPGATCPTSWAHGTALTKGSPAGRMPESGNGYLLSWQGR
jgi:hypothetical protein